MFNTDRLNYKKMNFYHLFNVRINAKSEVNKKLSFFDRVKVLAKRVFIEIFVSIRYCYSFVNIFFKYDYIIFTNSDDYKTINRGGVEVVNKFLYDIFKDTDYKILEIQYTHNKIISNHSILSYNLYLLICEFISFFIPLKDISNIEDEIKRTGAKINYKRILKRAMAKYMFFKFILKFTKPKSIFMTCFFAYNTLVARELGIKVYEFQHGIMKNHPFYSGIPTSSAKTILDYLFVFGQNEVDYFKDKIYTDNILILGSMMINHYSNVKNQEILSLKQRFKFIVCVSLQESLLNDIKVAINRLSNLHNDICFVLIPRHENNVLNSDLSDNVKVFRGVNTYEIIANSDYHMTCYSTCALEAPSLGTQNIFLNLYNSSLQYFSDYIQTYEFNHIIEPDGNLNFIYQNKFIENIKELNSYYISNEYDKNLNIIKQIIFQNHNKT